MIDWDGRSNKAATRNLLLSKAERLDTISYLGLPGTTALFEQELSRRYQCSSIQLVERDLRIYHKLPEILQSIRCSNISTIYGDIDDVIQQASSSTNLIWLDYCGQITLKKLKSLNKGLDLIKKNNGILAATYLAGRESTSIQELLSFFATRDPTANLSSCIKRHFLKQGAVSLPVLSSFGGCTQRELEPFLNDFISTQKTLKHFRFKKNSGRYLKIWAESQDKAQHYYNSNITDRKSDFSSVPFSLQLKAKSLAEVATFYSGPLRVTVQPYLDNVSMLLFLFEFDSSISSTQIEILPYLKGVHKNGKK